LILSRVIVGDAGGRLCGLHASADNSDTQCARPQTAQHGTSAYVRFCSNIMISEGLFRNAFGF
jgi:hypothetical protein